MQRIPLLVVLLALVPAFAQGASTNGDLLDPHVTLGSVTISQEDAHEARDRYDGASHEEKLGAKPRHAGLALRAPKETQPAVDALANAPLVQVTFGEVEYLLGADHAPAYPTFPLLPGSEISIPLTTRELVAAPPALPAAAPKLVPLAYDASPSSGPELSRAMHAARPSGSASPPVAAQSTDDGDAPSEPRWSERAALAGAAAVLVLTPFVLYHRLRGDNLLGHDSRAKLLELLRARPGLTPADAARELSVDPSTALYHLRRLVKEGIATTDGERRGARYFAAGTVAPAERQRVVFERESATLLEAIRAEPGASKTSLAGRLAIARATLHWHLTRLERAGLVRCERAGREVKVFPSSPQQTFS